MLNIDDCALIVIDIQEKLAKAAENGEYISKQTSKLVKGADLLSIPTIITEQYPKGLGSTISQIKDAINDQTPIIEKCSFSACNEENFRKIFNTLAKKQVLICGIETHICVLQTALDLINQGYDVFIVEDCSSSRRRDEHNAGLELLKQYGAKITCVEIVLFQWLKTSKHPKFKEVQALIK